MSEWVPVVDISKHQGVVDFRVMKDLGVEGLLLRAVHGQSIDERVAEYYSAARRFWEPEQIGFYEFINPKRGTPQQCADAFALTVDRLTGGRFIPCLMLDIESYKNEPPYVGTEPVLGAQFADYLWAHVERLAAIHPARRIGYSNRSYYDRAVGDPKFAAAHEWIVPRYPVYPPQSLIRLAEAGNPGPLLRWVERSPKPPAPAGWAEWAFTHATGPYLPVGAKGYAGWQFSAGYNRQGSRYGTSGSDLDLNIVRRDRWTAWTTPTPMEDNDMNKPILVQVAGDPAILKLDGSFVTSIVSGDTMARQRRLGLVEDAEPLQIERADLKTLIGAGDIDYSTLSPEIAAQFPGRTVPSDFAHHLHDAVVQPPAMPTVLQVEGTLQVHS